MSGEAITGAILVGGRSRRMGQDKALLRLETGGPPVVELVAGRLRMVTDEIVLVGELDRDLLPGLPRLHDTVPGSGPLGGLHAALSSVTSERVLVVACDMPFLNAELLRYMTSIPSGYDVLVPVLADGPQPLHAIYARTCLPHIEQKLREGDFRVTGWFGQVRVREIDRTTIERFDPGLLSCFNMNTPEDYAFAKRMRARGRGDSPVR